MRTLALDWGERRIGGALSDEEGKFAFALGKYFEPKTAIQEIAQLIHEKQIGQILIGQPLSLSGESNASSKKVQNFCNELKQLIAVPILFIDERFSSVGSQKILEFQGLNQKKQREIKDNITAQQMLQSYLDTKNK